MLPVQITAGKGGGGGRGAESYDRKKARASINRSILSDLKNISVPGPGFPSVNVLFLADVIVDVTYHNVHSVRVRYAGGDVERVKVQIPVQHFRSFNFKMS